MWRLTIVCVVVLAYAVSNGAVLESEVFSDDVQTRVGSTSILLKALEPKDSADVEYPLLDDQVSLLNTFLGRNVVVNTIRQVLESFRPIVINGNDKIPPLDPLEVTHLGPYVYSHTGVRMTTNIHNFRMDGLRWYVVNDVTFNALRLTVGVRMTLPWLIFTGRYDASAWIALVSHRSAGNFRLFINRIEAVADGRLGTAGGNLALRELNVKINVNDVQVQVTGMTGSSVLNGVINSLVQSITNDFINNEMENVSRRISEELFEIINNLLKDLTLDDILGFSV